MQPRNLTQLIENSASEEVQKNVISQQVQDWLKKHAQYDGNNILIAQARNNADTWLKLDQLVELGFILASAFSEIVVLNNTYIFEHPDWRKRKKKLGETTKDSF